MLTFKRTLDNELWIKHLFYPSEDPFVGKIFEMITGAAIKAKIKQLKQIKQLPVLDKRFRQTDGDNSPLTLARLFGWAVPREEKVEELRRFSVSPDYSALRAALGVPLA